MSDETIEPRTGHTTRNWPYPNPSDPVAGYPAVGLELANKLNDGPIATGGLVSVTLPGGGLVFLGVGLTDWVGIRLDTGRANANDRNFALVQGYFDNGELDVRVSNAQGGDPIAAGTSALAVTRTARVLVRGVDAQRRAGGALGHMEAGLVTFGSVATGAKTGTAVSFTVAYPANPRIVLGAYNGTDPSGSNTPGVAPAAAFWANGSGTFFNCYAGNGSNSNPSTIYVGWIAEGDS